MPVPQGMRLPAKKPRYKNFEAQCVQYRGSSFSEADLRIILRFLHELGNIISTSYEALLAIINFPFELRSLGCRDEFCL